MNKERVIIFEIDLDEKVNNNFNKMTVEIIEDALNNNFNRLDIYNEYFEITGDETLELDINVIFSVPIPTIYEKITDDGLIPLVLEDLDVLILPITKRVRKKSIYEDDIWQINMYSLLGRYGAMVTGKELLNGTEIFDKKFLYQLFYKNNVLGIRIKKLYT